MRRPEPPRRASRPTVSTAKTLREWCRQALTANENAQEPSSHAPARAGTRGHARRGVPAGWGTPAGMPRGEEPRTVVQARSATGARGGRLRPGAAEPDSRRAVPHRMPHRTITSATLGMVTRPRPPSAAGLASAAVPAILSSHLVQGAENPARYSRPAVRCSARAAGLLARRPARYVPGGQFPVPAPQPVQALFLFLQLGKGELARGDPGADPGAGTCRSPR